MLLRPHLEPPFAVIDPAAFRSNAADMTRRAAGTPIRLASKSVRCRREGAGEVQTPLLGAAADGL